MSAAMSEALAVAVQRLSELDRAEIERHLLRLCAEDRRLRFGRAMRDEAIRDYAAGIDFARDRVFGIHARDLALVGVAHLALAPAAQIAELGLSVDQSCRGRGYGAALLKRAVMHAANLGFRALFMHCLAENRVMVHLAVKAGLQVVVESGEANARLALDRSAHGGAMREAIEDQFALVDYVLKQQWSWIGRPALKPVQSAPAVRSGTPH
jgi:GNAT superfamily N-acetyltransferase